MLSNRLAFITLGIGCLAAAAGGSYLATRHNVADQMAPPMTAAETAPQATPNEPPAAVPTTPQPAAQGPVIAEPVQRRQESEASAATKPVAEPARVAAPARRAAADVAPVIPSQRVELPQTTEPAVVAPPEAETAPLAARTEEHAAEPVAASSALPTIDELVVPADSVIGLRTETTLSSQRARVEDRVEARVDRDVRVGGRVAIPAGTRALGSVIVVEQGGKLKGRARLGIRFHTLALADGTRLPISTETIYRLGDARGDDSAKKIGGGAVAGAILGAIIGGGKGAAIGATTGAAGGGAVVMTGEPSEAVFQSGAAITARITSPVTVMRER